MKLYVLDLDIKTIDVEKIKKKFQTKYNNGTLREIMVKRIYSEKGMIEIDKSGKLWSMEIIDDQNPYVYMLEDHIKMYIDKSTIKRKDEVFQIVPEHLSLITNKSVYSLSPKSMIHFVIEMIDETVRDVYFETDIDIQQHSVKEDIVTFLLLLNFIEHI
jgi:hypothetical protein